MAAPSVPVFDANDYRKRVLAAVEARGGMPASDPFEWYDVPLDAADSLTDDAVTEQVEAVWAFWQKHRNHPKYRGLVTALLAAHRDIAPALCAAPSRRQLAAKTRATRAERDEARFADLDAAIERLVERFGGIPRSKRAGVLAFAAQAGVDAVSAEARLARYPVVDDEPATGRPAAAPVSQAVYRQVRANLEELGRILGRPAFVSLYDLLGLDPAAPQPVLAKAREVAAARNRELRPDRRRALVDDLLAAVTTMLIDGDPEAYLDMLAEDVTERLRPRVAAAVLVEDELTTDDYTHLVGEAEALGLDHDRAVRAVSALARELGVAVPKLAGPSGPSTPGRAPAQTIRPPTSGRGPTVPGRSPTPSRGPAGTGSAKAWHEKLSRARAALRAGRVTEAQALVEEARQLAGGTMPPIRAVGDEVAAVLAEASQRWRAALDALAARRFTEAASNLERLLAIAADVPGPAGRSAVDALAEANRGSATATAALHNAESLAGAARELALLAAFNAAPDHPELIAALHRIGVRPARDIRTRQAGGGVVVSWAPSASPGDDRVPGAARRPRRPSGGRGHHPPHGAGGGPAPGRRTGAGVRRRRPAGRRGLGAGFLGFSGISGGFSSGPVRAAGSSGDDEPAGRAPGRAATTGRLPGSPPPRQAGAARLPGTRCRAGRDPAAT